MGCGASAGQQYHDNEVGIIKDAGRATCAWEDPVHSITQSADADVTPQISLGGGWMYETSPEVWQAFPSDVSAAMLVAWYCRESRFGYNTEEGGAFEVDFESLLQTDQLTGAQQRVGWVGSGQSSSEGGYYDDNGHGQADEEVAWVDYDEHLEDRLVDAWASGKKRVYYTAHGHEYEVDFTEMVQTNLTTGEQQDIGMEEIDESSPVAAVEPAKGGSLLAEKEGGGAWVRYTDPSTGQAYYSDGQSSYWDTSGPEEAEAAGGAAFAAPVPGAKGEKRWVQYTDPTTGHAYWSDGVNSTWENPTDKGAATSPGVAIAKTPQRSSGFDHGPQCESPPEQGGRPSKRDKKWTLGSGQQQVAASSSKDAHKLEGMPPRQPRLNAEVAAPPMQPTLKSDAQSRPAPTSLGGLRSPQPYSSTAHGRSAPQQAFVATPTQIGQAQGGQGSKANPPPLATSSATKRPRPEATGRPKVHIYQAPPRAGPKKERKWTLGPEQQRDRRACNAHASKPRAAPMSGPGPGRPEGRGSRGNGGASGPNLPTGSEWPTDPAARRVAEALFRDMDKSKKAALDERQKAYRAACLNWHPDKNPKHQGLAKEVFQFLQSLKSWYFA